MSTSDRSTPGRYARLVGGYVLRGIQWIGVAAIPLGWLPPAPPRITRTTTGAPDRAGPPPGHPDRCPTAALSTAERRRWRRIQRRNRWDRPGKEWG